MVWSWMISRGEGARDLFESGSVSEVCAIFRAETNRRLLPSLLRHLQRHWRHRFIGEHTASGCCCWRARADPIRGVGRHSRGTRLNHGERRSSHSFEPVPHTRAALGRDRENRTVPVAGVSRLVRPGTRVSQEGRVARQSSGRVEQSVGPRSDAEGLASYGAARGHCRH
jgi:hypothetical protein